MTASSVQQMAKDNSPYTTTQITLGEETNEVINIHRFAGRNKGPSVYIQAGIHGNEHPGILVATELLAKIEQSTANGSLAGSVTVVPVCNPIALSQIIKGEIVGRFDLNTGENFNRHFPDILRSVIEQSTEHKNSVINIETIRSLIREKLETLSFQNTSEQMKARLFQLASEHDIVLDLHADNCSVLHLYAPEQRKNITAQLASDLGCELALTGAHDANGALDDVLNHMWSAIYDELNFCSPDELPLAYTIELRGRYDLGEELIKQDANGLYDFLCHMGVINENKPEKQHSFKALPVHGIDTHKAGTLGVLKLHKTLGQRVSKGELIAEITSPEKMLEKTTEQLCANTDGILFCHSFHGVVPVGQTVFKIAGEKILHEESGHALEK